MLGEIKIKSSKVFEGLLKGKYPNILIEMSLRLISLFELFHITATVTSAYREGDPGVHGFFRGIDFRSRELSGEQIKYIIEDLNSGYSYDPHRSDMKVLIYHDVGKGLHLHLQSHLNTERR